MNENQGCFLGFTVYTPLVGTSHEQLRFKWVKVYLRYEKPKPK